MTEPKKNESNTKPSESTASALVALATASCKLFRDPKSDDAYAEVRASGHTEVRKIRSKGFRQWLGYRYYQAQGRSPGTQALADAIVVLEGQAVYEGDATPVHLRVGRIGQHEGAIYLDLCNETWQAVEITADGWRVVDNPPVRFRRAKAMLPLPMPEKGDVSEIRRFVNIEDRDWPVVAGWMLAALRPTGPYPALVLHGEQGSSKSTACRLLRSVIDPNAAPIRAEPRDGRDLVIAANNGWVVALDNVSHLHGWLSDALCRLSTGGGFSTRTLYENDEESIFDAQRPVLMNGIEVVAKRSDLLDRSLLVGLPVIPEHGRRTERDLMAKFGRARPRILGGLLDAVSVALANLDGTVLEQNCRMADFAQWATAGEAGLELAAGAFMAAYRANRGAANDAALESNPVGQAVLKLMEGRQRWSGTPTELLHALEQVADEKTLRMRSWPKAANTLSGILGRLAPNIRAVGIDVEHGKSGRREWSLARTALYSTVQSVHSAHEGPGLDGLDGLLHLHSSGAGSDGLDGVGGVLQLPSSDPEVIEI